MNRFSRASALGEPPPWWPAAAPARGPSGCLGRGAVPRCHGGTSPLDPAPLAGPASW